MFDKYLKERLGKSIIQNQYGFFILTPIDRDSLYLEDIYVLPEHRSKGIAQKMSDEAYQIAQKMGCKWLIGSVNIKAKGAEYSTKIIVENGFKFSHLSDHDNMIYFKKEVLSGR